MCHDEIGYHAVDKARARFATLLKAEDHEGLASFANHLHSDISTPGNWCGQCRRVGVFLADLCREQAADATAKFLKNRFEGISERLFPEDGKWTPAVAMPGDLAVS